MQHNQRKSRQKIGANVGYYDESYAQAMPKSSRLMESWPMLLIGVMFIIAFALAGSILGRNASASYSPEDLALPLTLAAPETLVATKGSLLPDESGFFSKNSDILMRQSVASDGKGDLGLAEAIVEPVVKEAPKAKPTATASLKLKGKTVKITPAAVDLNDEESLALAPKRIKKSPVALEVEGKVEKVVVKQKESPLRRRLQLAEENCLARAVYFESRSEADLGQLAVAKVILNRVKSSKYPNTICGVVYQGSGRRNSCQFSFACDGLPDDVKQPASWAHAKKIAQRAINNDPAVRKLGSSLFYHADYVNPKWSKTMRRIARIGRHIFYAPGNNS